MENETINLVGKKGYFQNCRYCGKKIWMQFCFDQKWKPLDFPNKTVSGDWELHDCPIYSRR